MDDAPHTPVLTNEVIAILEPRPGDSLIDATFGFGGHSFALLPYLQPNGQILALEWDPRVVVIMEQQLMAKQVKGIKLRNDNFSRIKQVARQEGVASVRGVIFDLGVSTWHYRGSGGGFSFNRNEPLDMRINPEVMKVTAFEVVNQYSQAQLTEILTRYGEERQAGRIASEIVKRRREKRIESSEELAELVLEVKGGRRGKTHPATKVFMALRTFLNGELDNLATGLKDSYDLLQPGGKLVVLSFQGLEDVVIKKIFKELQQAGARALNKHVIRPSFNERKRNPAARSAKIRALVKPTS